MIDWNIDLFLNNQNGIVVIFISRKNNRCLTRCHLSWRLLISVQFILTKIINGNIRKTNKYLINYKTWRTLSKTRPNIKEKFEINLRKTNQLSQVHCFTSLFVLSHFSTKHKNSESIDFRMTWTKIYCSQSRNSYWKMSPFQDLSCKDRFFLLSISQIDEK